MVEYQLRSCRNPGKYAVDEIADQVFVQSSYHRAVPVFLQVPLARPDGLVESLVRNILVEDTDGDGLLGVPVLVEPVRDVFDDGAYGGDILVEKFARHARLVILVCEIAAADDGHLVVDRKRLVVHAAVKNIEVRNEADEPRAASRERIEYPDFDIDVVIEAQQAGIDRFRKRIVHQEAHPDTAVRCLY